MVLSLALSWAASGAPSTLPGLQIRDDRGGWGKHFITLNSAGNKMLSIPTTPIILIWSPIRVIDGAPMAAHGKLG